MPTKSDISERRNETRKAAKTAVQVKSRWQLATAKCVDASSRGLLLSTPQDFAQGDDVELALELTGGERVMCEAKVVREQELIGALAGRGYGVRITSMKPQVKKRFLDWLERLPEVPQRLVAPRTKSQASQPKKPRGGVLGRLFGL